MSAVSEQERTLDLMRRIEELEEVAESLPPTDPRRSKIDFVLAAEISDIAPMRVRVTAHLLEISEPTVRSWVQAGILLKFSDTPRLLLDPSSVLAVRKLVSELRQAGRNRDLLDELYFRLVDQSVIDSDELQESLEQMRRGQGRRVRAASA